MAGPGTFKLEINAEEMASAFGELAQDVETALNDAVRLASSMTYAKASEMAAEKLQSRRKIFQDALSYEQAAPGIWVVSLAESALWIEDGLSAHSMIDDLLRHNPKVSKDGNRYKAIPFEHSKPESQQSTKAQEITKLVKQELKRRREPLKKIAMNPDGTPKLGRVFHENIASPFPSPKASHPVLHGLSIYQRKGSNGKVQRDVLTVRIVSDKQKAEGKWYHPGLEAVKIIDQVFEWISAEFDNKILPEVMSKFDQNNTT
jgi:hypothetical protein